MKLKRFLFIFSLFFIYACTKEDIGILDTSEETIIISIPEQNLEWKKAQNWLANAQHPNGLLESSENTNFVSLYDNSLAALVFIADGKIDKAEKIFDFFNSKITPEFNDGNGGFYQRRDKNGENGVRTWMGDNAWLLIALNNYHNTTGNKKYERLSNVLENWIRSLQDSDGGLWGGYNENGTQIHKVTEGIITAFNAVEGYDDFHKNILNYLKNERWDITDQLLIAWPDNPAYYYAMDLHPLSYSIFEDFPESTLIAANRYLNSQISTVSKAPITGYAFDDDKDVIWLEGTAQMALANLQANMTLETSTLITEIEKTFIPSILFDDSIGIPYASNHGSSYGASALWNHADTVPAISSTAWYLFVKMNFNPFKIGYIKNIPKTDKFWLQEIEN